MLHRIPLPRRPRFDLSDLPRHWFGDAVMWTHSANGLALVFPKGERFFVRSVRQMMDEVDDPELRERVRGFIAQEALHGRAHEASFAVLEADGFEIAEWLEWYDDVAFGRLEPAFPPSMRLATTAALEHLTAVMGRRALEDELLDGAHPAMRRLLKWHAVEEIEHRSVAFDVFMATDGRLWVRWAGMGVGLASLLVFWTSATRHLLRQDPAATPERLRRERREARQHGHSRARLLIDALSWLRPGFHPDDDHEAAALAEQWLADQEDGFGQVA